MDDEERMKLWIDTAPYQELLWKVRFAPAGDSFFQGEMGVYYLKRLKEKREEVGDAEHVRASKAIGWD